MSAEATGYVWRNSPYRGAELLVHLAIADVVNDAHGNEFWMSTYELAKKARVSRSTVVSALATMVDQGCLELVEAGGDNRRPSRYLFAMTSATGGLARPESATPLARSPRANSIDTKEQTKQASATLGLVRSCPTHGGISGLDCECA